MKTQGVVLACPHALLNSELDGSERSATDLSALFSSEEFPVSTGYEGGWEPEPQNAMEKRRIHCLCRKLAPPYFL